EGASKELVKASAGIDAKQSMWMSGIITDDMRKKLADTQFKVFANKLESINFAANVTDAIVVDINVNTSDAEAPKMIKMQIDTFLPFIRAAAEADEKTGELAKEIFKNLTISANQGGLNVN